jgi:hypothetical protein
LGLNGQTRDWKGTDQSARFGQEGAALQQAHPPPCPPTLGLLDCPAPTANELNWRLVLAAPHFGQAAASVLLMLRTSFSNFDLQVSQTYS